MYELDEGEGGMLSFDDKEGAADDGSKVGDVAGTIEQGADVGRSGEYLKK